MAVSEDSDYFGKESAGKSAKISVKNAEPGDIYTVYLPYDSAKGSTDSYLSTMLKASSSLAVEDGAGLVMAKDYKLDEEGQIEDPLTSEDVTINMITGTIPMMAANGESDVWGHLSYPTRSTTKNEKRAVGISLVVLEKQDFTIRLDDTAVSKAGVLSRFRNTIFPAGHPWLPSGERCGGKHFLVLWEEGCTLNRRQSLNDKNSEGSARDYQGVLDGRKLSDQNAIPSPAQQFPGAESFSGKDSELRYQRSTVRQKRQYPE